MNEPDTDPLQEQTELADRLSRLVAPEDDRRSLLAFTAVMNLLDGFRHDTDDEHERHARTLLMRGLGGPITGDRSARRSALSPLPGPPADSVMSDARYRENARRMFAHERRIIGGVVTTEYPDCVAVGDAGGWCCTGTVIAPRVVVTAAHCARDGCADRVLVGNNVADDDGATVIGVATAHVHPGYGGADRSNDLCVLILDAAAAPAPRPLASRADVDSAVSTRVVGFGHIDEFGSTGYGKRRMVDVPMASADPKFGATPATEFVAGAPTLDRDSCSGDSGGPAYVEVDGAWRLAGATSRSTASAFRRCGDGGIYTRVAEFEHWINDVSGGLYV